MPKYLLLLLLLITLTATGQSNYNAKEAFAPGFYPYPGNVYRSAGGQPGPEYWQNRADYSIQCELNTDSHSVTGIVRIRYINNSPDALDFVWLQLDQNIYKDDSRGTATTTQSGGRWANTGFTGGYNISSVTIGKAEKARYTVTDTRMQIWLNNKLSPRGDSVLIAIEFSFSIPEYGTDRMGRLETSEGWVYEIAQWFPRMCVYDDLQGWNVLPYLGQGEFYLEYGDIDFSVTAPSDLVVVGSGELLNPGDCYNAEELTKYNEAKKSDKTVVIRSAKDVEKKKRFPGKSKLTWKFRINNTRDAAWAASRAFILDAAKINLPEGKSSLAMSAYPKESTKDKKGNDWRRSTEMIKGSIEHYSSKWFPYPYPAAVNVAGIVGGMEYPGIVFCSYSSSNSSLWSVTDHEFGHTWFPMIVGSNERKFAWMDEGFNTFINDLSTEAFRNGEFKEDGFFTDPASPMMVRANFNNEMDELYTVPDVVQQMNLGMAAYLKPAVMLHALRNNVLGANRFDAAFREYIQRWAFKHPTPWDFFHTMENVAGEDLSWFWRGWVFNNWKIDQSVKGVEYLRNEPGLGAEITLENLEKMPMPVTMLVKESNGKEHRIELPVEIWQRGSVYTYQVPTTSNLAEIILDPDNKMPDWNRANNRWKKAF